MNTKFQIFNHFPEVEGGQKVKDTMKAKAWIGVLITFVNPIFAATAFIEDRYQSRYWYHLVIPASVFPYVVPVIGVWEYFITTHGMSAALWYLVLITMYFQTSKSWISLVT